MAVLIDFCEVRTLRTSGRKANRFWRIDGEEKGRKPGEEGTENGRASHEKNRANRWKYRPFQAQKKPP
ncbi:MAG: hypothetical protein HQM04_15275 [Magnetococcales bacterium]|nr:hypothetical protein [Magnetococcales bacterium]